MDRYIEKYDGRKYWELYPPHEKYERVLERIKYLISQESNISDVYYHNYMNIKIKMTISLWKKYIYEQCRNVIESITIIIVITTTLKCIRKDVCPN